MRGTGLMGANDAIAPLVEERLGVRTFAADEMGWLLAALLALEVRAHAPLEIDLSGGLSTSPTCAAALEPLAAELRDRSARRGPPPPARARARRTAADDAIEALPAPGTDTAPRTLPPDLPEHGARSPRTSS